MTQRRPQLDFLAIAWLLACCVFWGFQQVLVKATLPEVAPVMQASLRFLGALVLLLVWCRWRGVTLFGNDGTLRAGLLAGLLFCAEFVCIYVGLKYTSASRLTIFLYTSPFWVALLLHLLVKSERLARMQWAGLLLAFAAVGFALQDGVVTHADASTSPWWWLGDALGIAAGAFWGLTTVVIRSTHLVKISPEKLLFYQVAISSALLPVLSWQLGESWSVDWRGFAITSILLQTVVGGFASFLLWMWLLGRYPATQLSVFVFFTPVFALFFGTWWLGEAITWRLVAALMGVALGIVLVNRRPSA
jgi:drug/metabolite transporter (DMT)-like permease